jgi:hypothetical protein
MAKKDLSSLGADLSALAAIMPTQRPAEPFPPKIVPSAPREPEAQFSFSLRASLRKQLLRLAADADMTARAFVLLALKDRGLDVKDDDPLDLRKDTAGQS